MLLIIHIVVVVRSLALLHSVWLQICDFIVVKFYSIFIKKKSTILSFFFFNQNEITEVMQYLQKPFLVIAELRKEKFGLLSK